MRRLTKFTLALIAFISLGKIGNAQSIMDPNDPIVTYNASAPPTEPTYGQIGKWVRSARVFWNTSDYKCYIYKGVPFRLKFPKTYNPTANDGKRYPMMVFFHGLGEAGGIYDNEFQLYHGGEFFKNSVNNGTFDGYIICLQSQGFWGGGHYDYVKEIMDYMITNNKLDPFQVSINGLSAGGQACWEMMQKYPQCVASALPMSWTSYFYGDAPWTDVLKYTPIWNFQGAMDGAPAAGTSQYVRDQYLAAGGNYKYTEYADLGHGTWDRVWTEPDFWGFQKRAYISNPWPLYGRTDFCPGDPISATLGVPPGFNAYEWKKDNVVIPGATTNSYTATTTGTYCVRVLKGTLWSEWSRVPVVIKIKGATVSPNIAVSGLASRVLPALDGSTSVQLEVPSGYVTYDWQKVSTTNTLSTTRFLTTSTPGDYRVKVTEQFGCSSDFSNPFSVIDANGPNKPDAAINLIATTISKTAIRLDWSDNPAPQFNETNFEVYEGSQAGGPYKFVGIVGQDIRTFTVSGLNPNTQYYFKVRAVNNTAAAPASNEANGTTQVDTQAPSAPTGLSIVKTSRTSITVQWNASTDDVGVTKYEIYVNGQKSYVTTGLQFTMSGLQSPNNYNITVKAKDFAGNASPFSNQVTGEPLLSGLDYKFFLLPTTPTTMPDYTIMIPTATGTLPNVSLTPRTTDFNIGFLWEGYINIPTTGTYRFRTNSDDGSKLYLGPRNGTGSPFSTPAYLIVNNDGPHAFQDATSSAMSLQAGTYPIAMAFWQGVGGFGASLLWSNTSTGENFVNIPDAAFSDTYVTNGTKPNKPTNLVATPVSFKRIDLSWTDGSTNETAFEIWRSTSPSGNFTTIAQVPAGTTTYQDTDLNPNARYYYRVRALNQYGESDFDKDGPGVDYSYYEQSSVSSLASFTFPITPVKTGHVDNFGLGMQNRADNFQLKFTTTLNIPSTKIYTFFVNSDDGARLYIDGALLVDNDGLHGPIERSASKNLAAGAHTIMVTYFESTNTEVLSVQISAAGLPKQNIPNAYLGTALTNAVTQAPLATPGQPTNLLAAPISKSSVQVTWTDNATNETKFELYRSSNNTSNYVLYATLNPNTTSFTDAGLFANSIYYYKIRAIGTGNNSSYSNEDSAKTWNTTPVILQLPTRTAKFGVTTSIVITATDADGDQVAFTPQNLPAFASLVDNGNNTATLTLNPTSGQQGLYTGLRINAVDVNGGTDFTQFNLTVNNNNDPSLNLVANYTLNENDNLNIPLSATDADAGTVFSWSSNGLPNASTLTPGAGGTATLNIHPNFAAAGVYRGSVTVADGNGGYTSRQFTITVNDKDPNVRVYMRIFGTNTIGFPWNSISSATTTNLVDDKGNTTSVGLNFPSGFNVGNAGPSTGNNSGVYPDAVLKDYYVFGPWWMAPTGATTITGLDPATKYNITLLGASIWDLAPDNGNTDYTINGVTKSLYVQGNTQNTVTFTNISPAADGTIAITIAKGAGASAGYMNSIVLTSAFDDGTTPVAPSALNAQNFPGQGVKLTWQNLAYNESGYEIYRGTNGAGPFSLIGTAAGGDATSYMDNTIAGNTTYYYKVRAMSVSNIPSAYTNVVSVLTTNKMPVMNAITSVSLKNNQTLSVNVSATDDPADVITLSASGLPQFATFTDNGNGTGVINIVPLLSSVGNYTGIKITAKDNNGGSSSTSFDITVVDKDVQSIYVNFTNGTPAGKPWNNFNGWPSAGAVMNNLKDDADVTTTVSVSLPGGFLGSGLVGVQSNTGKEIYPAAVVRSGLYDNATTTKNITVSGLSTTKKYNFVFFPSHDDGTAATTNYTINGVTVSLNASYNLNKTVQINGVTTATGSITIGVSKAAGSDFMYLNAMVIQSYTPASAPFIGPTDLRVVSATTKSISLQWQDRSDNETGFTIYRAVAGGAYSSIGTVSANVTNYVDSDVNLTSNKAYYYLVRATKGTSPTTSNYSNVAIGYTYAYTVNVNVSDKLNSGAPWNNLGTIPQVGFVWNNFRDNNNNVTSIGMVETGLWAGMYGAGVNTGNNSGIFPDNVMVENYGLFPGQSATLKLTGLNVTQRYNLSFFSSSVNTGDVTSAYTVNGNTVMLNAAQNKSGTVTMYDVVPDEFGEILITVAPGTPGAQYGLLAALIVQAYTPATNSIPTPPGRQISTVVEAPRPNDVIPDKINMSSYPNPFDQYFTLTVSTETPDRLDVFLYDINGRLVHQQRFADLNSGTNTVRVQPDKTLAPGVYIVRAILGNNKDLGLIKIVKK